MPTFFFIFFSLEERKKKQIKQKKNWKKPESVNATLWWMVNIMCRKESNVWINIERHNTSSVTKKEKFNVFNNLIYYNITGGIKIFPEEIHVKASDKTKFQIVK